MVEKPLISTFVSPLLLLLLAVGGVAAAELEPVPAANLEAATAAEKDAPADEPAGTAAGQEEQGDAVAPVPADQPPAGGEALPYPAVQGPEVQPHVIEGGPLPEDERQVEVLERKGGALGYNFVFGEGERARALEYGFLKSSRSGGLFYRHMEKDTNLELEGFYLNENDYHGDLLMDYRGDYRLHLRTESLYHNMDRELLFTPSFQAGRNDGPTPATYSAVQDPVRDYGVSVVQDRADFRYRLHNFPLHVNLGYWRYVKEGTIQQRFADTAFEGTTNTLYAQPRSVDHQIQEGRVGLDSHLGPVDLVYDFKVRYFEDRLSTPVASYEPRNAIDSTPDFLGGLRQHNENPDSSFFSHTIKLHSSLAGGLVGSGSYSFEQRENLTELSDTTGVRRMKVYLQNAAGDLVYTPCRTYTFALKYRRQEIDHGNRGPLTNNSYVDPVLAKPAVETTRDLVTGTVSYRPSLKLALVGEYRGDFQRRSEVSPVPSSTTWALPDSTATHTGSLSVYYRPVKGLRSSVHYSYATTDNPSYGASFQNRQEAKVLLTYALNNRWGLTSHAVLRRDENKDIDKFLINYPFQPLSYSLAPLTSRSGNSENANIGVWWVPIPKLTVGANYSYLHQEVEQGILFTGVFNGSEAASQFSSRSHVYGVNASYTLGEKCDLAVTAQQIRSAAAFTPSDTTFTVIPGSTTGIKAITEQDTVISSLSARGEYRFSSVLSTTLEYTLNDYNELKSAYKSYSGTVHAIVAGLAAKW
ncbi:hypothetical protein KOM00_07830 [Geomonas sp. Red69]|uniref:Uncharacterized protein n=1 Tax=Geomonas diazotrophica TaxID=2843197 RepID=A0ABX8JJR6_9BACT|nr:MULTISPECIES: hypothetical protein [Geomonas]MBU5636643.1 hypothetical protein [Geomonas diazotrophica]QWV98538.1 hypothetical protein KP005_04405 [Geomonas nitrogeniifigens]QXE87721.1 hypothetical protein KP003_04765 [Geomonas nitrogeniifigens]